MEYIYNTQIPAYAESPIIYKKVSQRQKGFTDSMMRLSEDLKKMHDRTNLNSSQNTQR